VVAAFPGGVWFVDLAATRGSGSVGRATLKALGMPETPGVPPAQVAAVELAEDGRSLVILDNACETGPSSPPPSSGTSGSSPPRRRSQ
jgi:hypothetical protein